MKKKGVQKPAPKAKKIPGADMSRAERLASLVKPPETLPDDAKVFRDSLHKLFERETGLRIGVINIGPELAAKALKFNVSNRHPIDDSIQRITEEIVSGRWQLNGESIIFSDSGRLLDGQNRLQAIIRAGKAVKSVVVIGVPDPMFSSLDQGSIRGAKAIAETHGWSYANTLGTTMLLVRSWQRGTLGQHRKDKALNVEVERLMVEMGAEVYPSVEWASKAKGRGKMRLLPVSLLAFLHYVFTKRDALMGPVFMEALVTGARLHEDEPVFLLRRVLTNYATSKLKPSRTDLLGVSIKAWNATRNGKKLQLLAYKHGYEPFPEVK